MTAVCRMLVITLLLARAAHASVLCGAGTTCAAGTYCPTPTSGCRKCPLGKFSSNENSPSCAVCAPGQYATKAGAPSCPACPMGKFQPKESQRACSPCAAGHFAAEPFQVMCKQCAVGQYSLQGWYFCDKTCPAGRYQHGSTCPTCAAGRYSAKPGQSACALCAVGRYSKGSKAYSGTKKCTACPSGRTSFNRNTYKKGVAGGTECVNEGRPCPRGRFSPGSGWTTARPVTSGCKRCPAARYAAHFGSSHCKACRCKPGEWRASSLGRTWCTCNACPAGKHGPGGTAQACTTCAAGWYQPKPRQSQCAICPNGKTSDAQHISAGAPTYCGVVCTAGRFAPHGGWETRGGALCAACPAGKYQELRRQSSCSRCSCEAGKHQLTVRDCVCRSCEAGRYVLHAGRMTCTKCQRGKYQPGADAYGVAHRCKRCPLGKYSLGGAGSCRSCPDRATVQRERKRFVTPGWAMCGADTYNAPGNHGRGRDGRLGGDGSGPNVADWVTQALQGLNDRKRAVVPTSAHVVQGKMALLRAQVDARRHAWQAAATKTKAPTRAATQSVPARIPTPPRTPAATQAQSHRAGQPAAMPTVPRSTKASLPAPVSASAITSPLASVQAGGATGAPAGAGEAPPTSHPLAYILIFVAGVAVPLIGVLMAQLRQKLARAPVAGDRHSGGSTAGHTGSVQMETTAAAFAGDTCDSSGAVSPGAVKPALTRGAQGGEYGSTLTSVSRSWDADTEQHLPVGGEEDMI